MCASRGEGILRACDGLDLHGRRVWPLPAGMVRVRPRHQRHAIRRNRLVDCIPSDHVSSWHRRDQSATRPHDHALDAALRADLVAGHSNPRARLHGFAPRDGSSHDRRVRGVGLRPLLCVLGSDAHSDVPAHRRLGRPESAVRGHQILSVHVGRQCAPARRHSGALFPRRRNLRHPRLESDTAVTCTPNMAIYRLLRGICRESAHVALPYVASGRPCGGTHGGQRHPRQRAPEDGDVRLSAAQPADPSGRQLSVRQCDDRPFADRHYLWRLHGARAGGLEEIDRLFQRQPHGLRDAGHLHIHPARYRRGGPSDGEPRHYHRSPLLVRRCDL